MGRFWLARLMTRNLYFHHDSLGFGKEFATVLASFAADPTVLEAAERCAQITNEVAVDPDCAGPHSACHPVRATRIFGEHHGVQAIPGVIRQPDSVGFTPETSRGADPTA